MEAGSFHSQLLSVVEVLAKAAVDEIHRRVDDSCAVLRLELSRSRRDIDLLRRKWDMMEAELRRSRIRVNRKTGVRGQRSGGAANTCPHTASVVHRDTQRSPDWSSQEDTDTAHTPAQCDLTDGGPQIKVEPSGDLVWKTDPDDTHVSGPDLRPPHPVHADVFVDSDNPVHPVLQLQIYHTFQEQPLQQNQSKPVVKQEEADDSVAAADSSRHCETGAQGEGHLWTSTPPGDISVEHYEQSQPGAEDAGPHIESTGSPREKRPARPFGVKRSRPSQTHGALAQSIGTNQSSTRGNTSLPRCRTPADAPCSLTRMRIRTPWRSSGGEKRFSCTYCGKRFLRCSQMTEHLRSHTGEKPFSCQQCGKAFTKQFNLIRHAVVHSGEKPFGCSLCGKCFTQRSSLKSHLKTAH